MPKKESNTVKHSLNPSNPPALTQNQQAELVALRSKADADIDYSDLPELGDDFWQAAKRVSTHKQQITLRLDADVLEFFKATGSRYQSRINAVLKAYVQAQH